ncbi:GtrA-like protein [Caballeronia arvi]|uniref:GtrA-like protein n=1 Tax=Caballeronia arvi TaxID=1777135 RepID=A0A158JDG8_9BURK|nr:GtrA family protein [Caballeronia arvi]SAL66431.1 GtrA-like protein [Caballeronia arvi]
MITEAVSTRMQLLRYLIVGGLNTLGAGAIIFTLQAAGVAPLLANLAGYAIGIAASFLVNSRITFNVESNRGTAMRFLIVTGISYLANVAVVFVVLRLSGAPYLAQACGIPVYTIVGFLGNKYWALKPGIDNES